MKYDVVSAESRMQGYGTIATRVTNRVSKSRASHIASLQLFFIGKQIYIKFANYMARTKTNIEIKNKRAAFEYEFLDTFTAGVCLVGTEIKSIRAGKAALTDAYGYFSGNELFIKNMHIAEYWWGNLNNHDPRRDRKLLLHRKELSKLRRRSSEKGLTIVAVKLFIADNGYAKLIIALARGKKIYDKRASIKEKDLRRGRELEIKN